MKLSEIILLETVDKKFFTLEEIAEFLIKNCSEWQDFSKPLWRQNESYDSQTPNLRSTRERRTNSVGGTQNIQKYIFSLPEYKNFPNRTKSIFCSTNSQTEVGSDSLKAIFPLDGIKMGQTDNKDFNIIEPFDNAKMYQITYPLKKLAQEHGSYSAIVNDQIAGIRKWVKEKGPIQKLPESNIETALKQMYFTIRNGKFESYFSPEKLGIHLIDAKSVKDLGSKQTEVWFEGKYVSIPEDMLLAVAKLANEIRDGKNEAK